MVLCHARHRVGFMIAQKSYDKRVLGFFAKLMGCIPVQRPQDSAKKGTGTITLDGSSTVGMIPAQAQPLAACLTVRAPS